MIRFWKRGRRPLDLEGELRRNRPEPRAEFVQLLTERMSDGVRMPAARLRLALAAVLALLLLGGLAAFGGLSYAAEGMQNAAQSVQSGSGNGNNNDNDVDDEDDDDPDDDEYEEECEEREEALEEHQEQEKKDLAAHQKTSNHPGLTAQQRRAHYRAEDEALAEHQAQEREEFEEDCPDGDDDDDDDGDDGDD